MISVGIVLITIIFIISCSSVQEDLRISIKENDFEKFEKTINKANNPNISMGPQGAEAPVMVLVAFKKRYNMLEYLMKRGADANLKYKTSDGNMETTPLIWFVLNRDLEAVRIVLENGTNPNFVVEDKHGATSTAISTAVLNNHCDIYKLLMKFKADINVVIKVNKNQGLSVKDIIKGNNFTCE